MVVFMMALYSDPAKGLQVIFFCLSLVMLCIIPIVFLIPDTARARRRAGPRSGAVPPPSAEPVQEPMPAVHAVD
jgi:hypothetical protein